MKIMLAISLSICILALDLGAQQKSNIEIRNIDGIQYFYIDIDKAVETIDFDIREFIDSARIVILDNNKDALIGSFSRIGISTNHIAIFPNAIGQQLKLFSEKGKFIRNIGNSGRGPNEYRYLNGLHISEENGQIICEPANLKDYYRFNFQGDPLVPIPRSILGFHLFYPLNKTEILDLGYPNYPNQGEETDQINLTISNEEGKKTFEKSPIKQIFQTRIGGSQIPLILYPYNKEFRIQFGQDTLYSFNPIKRQLSVTAVFTSKKFGYNFKQMNSLRKDNQFNKISGSLVGKIHFEVVCESPDYILLKGFKREKYIDDTEITKEIGNYVLDKKNKVINAVKFKDSYFNLDLNKRLYSSTLYAWQFYDNKYGVAAFQAIDLKKEISRIIEDKKTPLSILSTMTKIDGSLDIVESNVILFVYYLKQPK